MARSASRDAVLHADEMEDNEDLYIVAGRAAAPPPVTVPTIQEQPKPMRHSHPKPPPTPNTGAQPEVPQNMPNPLLPSAPASPPTPAPSPTPHQRQRSWNPAGDVDNTILDDFMLVFSRLNTQGRESWLEEIVESCDNHLLSYLHQLVSPRLKKDPFQVLPNELCFRVRAKARTN
jgi:F-box and WD-40 domain protein CDC4